MKEEMKQVDTKAKVEANRPLLILIELLKRLNSEN